jgi:hypothetical protein
MHSVCIIEQQSPDAGKQIEVDSVSDLYIACGAVVEVKAYLGNWGYDGVCSQNLIDSDVNSQAWGIWVSRGTIKSVCKIDSMDVIFRRVGIKQTGY